MKVKNKKWEFIADIIIHEIEQDHYKKDERLPSENQMAEQFGVPRSDIRKVYGRLKEWGYIYSRQGQGSFFAGRREKIPFSLVRGRSFTQMAQRLDLPYRAINIYAAPIAYDAEIFEQFHAEKGDTVWKIALLRILDNMPAALHVRYLPEKLFPSLPEKAAQITSFYEFLNQFYPGQYQNAGGRSVINHLTKEERDWLELPAYATERIYTAKTVRKTDGAVLELCRTIYRSDRFVFLHDDEAKILN